MNQRKRASSTAVRVLCCICLTLASLPAATRQAEEKKPRKLPAGIELEGKTFREEPDGRVVFEGPLAFEYQGSLFQADRVTFREGRYIEAEGNVLLIWQGNRITGTTLEYDLDTDTGSLENAIGAVEPDYYFWADRVDIRGKDKIHLKRATVTSCTQPVPYWSFVVSSANITVDRYAHMLNVRLKTGRLPVIYLPYLLWPVKSDRAFGLLIPEFRSTREQGRAVHQELFIPIGQSADLTLFGRYFTKSGLGGGGELRVIPNKNGQAVINGFFIDDKVKGFQRYRATYQQTQKFRNGFRLVADVNLISDFAYFSDFEKEINLVSSPTILARLELSRNGPWTSLNVRELRREQLFLGGGSLVQQTLPEIEWRGRTRKLGRTPFYLGFESSIASIQQRGLQQNVPIDADYIRGDVFPTLTMPISPRPWFDINPRISYRATHYTQRQSLVTDASGTTTRTVESDALTRTLFGAGVDIVGPKFFRIYETPNNRFSPRFKHTFEPNLSYGYLEVYDRSQDILLFDEVDRFNGAGAQMLFGVRSRLIAKRPRSKPALGGGIDQPVILPPGIVAETGGRDEGPSLSDAGTRSSAGEPVEVATFEMRQSRSFDEPLSRADLDGDGVQEDTSLYSDIQLVGRFNPSQSLSLDLRSNYHILYNRVSNVSLSGLFRSPRARVRFSLVHREGLGVTPVTLDPIPDDTQLRLTTGFSVFRNKLHLDFDTSFDANPGIGQSRVPDKRWRVTYATQCCTFMIEKLNRDFSSLDSRRDLFFRIDLKGVGKLLDFNY